MNELHTDQLFPYNAREEQTIISGALEDQQDCEMELCGGLLQVEKLIRETLMSQRRRDYLLSVLDHLRVHIYRQTNTVEADIKWRDN